MSDTPKDHKHHVTHISVPDAIMKTGDNLFRSYFDLGQVGMCITSLDQKWLHVNARLCEMLGYTLEELVRTSWTELTHPEDLELDLAQFRLLVSGEIERYSIDKRFIHKSGKIVFTHLTVSCKRRPDNSIEFVIASLEDITDQKQSEAALRASEEKLRGLYELSPLGIALTDMQGHYVEFNDAFREICGYSREELNQLDYWALTPKEYADEEAEQLESLNTKGYYGPYEKEYIHKNGSRIPLRLNGVLIHDSGGKPHIWSIVENITESKRTENELREKEERLALATLYNGVGIWDWNLVTQQMIWDKSMYALYHIRREDFIGTEEAWRASLHPDDLERGDHEVEAAIRGEKPFDTEFRVVWPDGEIRYIKAVAKVFRDEQGTPLRMLGTNVDITERKKAELKLQQSEAHFRFVTESAQALIWMSGMDKLCTWFNKVWLDFTGRTMEQEVGDGWVEGVHPDDVQHCYEIYVSHFDLRKPFSLEYRLRRHDGEYRWIIDNGTPRFNTQGIFEGYIGSCFDITDRKRSEENLRITASVFDNSQDGIVITDTNNNLIEVNPAFTRITGYEREEVIGKNPRLLSSGHQNQAFYEAMWQSLEQNKTWRGEVWNRRKSGEIFVELLSISAIIDDNGQVQRYVGVFSDISRIKEHEAELTQVANYDALTGIPNRRLLADRLGQAILQARRSGKLLSVCYLDLDGFKQVNDQYGHEAGDQLLVETTRRLQKVLRAEDTLARLGGDEFVLLLSDLTSMQECLQILDRVLHIIAMPVIIGNNQATVSASIGVTFHSSPNEDGDTLLRQADQAMYVAKQSGKNRYHFYDLTQDQAS